MTAACVGENECRRMWKSGFAAAFLVVIPSVVSSSNRADGIDFNTLTEREIVPSVPGSGGGGPVAVFGCPGGGA